MDNTKEMLDKLKTYPNTYKELFQYFATILKKETVQEETILNIKIVSLRPHLIRFIELKKLDFLDALIYTNWHISTPEFKELQDKTIAVCFSKLEVNKPLTFDLF